MLKYVLLALFAVFCFGISPTVAEDSACTNSSREFQVPQKGADMIPYLEYLYKNGCTRGHATLGAFVADAVAKNYHEANVIWLSNGDYYKLPAAVLPEGGPTLTVQKGVDVLASARLYHQTHSDAQNMYKENTFVHVFAFLNGVPDGYRASEMKVYALPPMRPVVDVAYNKQLIRLATLIPLKFDRLKSIDDSEVLRVELKAARKRIDQLTAALSDQFKQFSKDVAEAVSKELRKIQPIVSNVSFQVVGATSGVSTLPWLILPDTNEINWVALGACIFLLQIIVVAAFFGLKSFFPSKKDEEIARLHAELKNEKALRLRAQNEWEPGFKRIYSVDHDDGKSVDHIVTLVRSGLGDNGKPERFYDTEYLSGAASESGVSEKNLSHHLKQIYRAQKQKAA